MTVSPLRIHWLAVVTSLAIAVVLSACSEPAATPTSAPAYTPTPEPTATPTSAPTYTPTPEPTATPTSAPTYTPTPEPTATPTSAPTYTPTPEPMLTQVSTPAYPGELDLDVDSLWQDAFDAFSVSEQGCIRSELGDGFLESLLAVRVFDGLETDELWHVSIFGCLDSETANTLFLSLLSANVDLDEGTEACLQGVLADVDIAEVFAADLPDAAPESAAIVEEFDGKLLACLGDLVPPNGGATDFGPPPPDDSLLWQYDTGNPGELVIVSPTAADGVVYAGSYDDRVYALDAETGELLWSFKAENGLSPLPLAGGGVVLFRGHALDAYTGELLWRDDSVRSGSNNAAVLSDGTVYIPTEPRDNGSASARLMPRPGSRCGKPMSPAPRYYLCSSLSQLRAATSMCRTNSRCTLSTRRPEGWSGASMRVKSSRTLPRDRTGWSTSDPIQQPTPWTSPPGSSCGATRLNMLAWAARPTS